MEGVSIGQTLVELNGSEDERTRDVETNRARSCYVERVPLGWANAHRFTDVLNICFFQCFDVFSHFIALFLDGYVRARFTQDVRTLRSRQFPEDAGPLSHPIRPESYIAMDNFYTATVYVKGAEVDCPRHAM